MDDRFTGDGARKQTLGEIPEIGQLAFSVDMRLESAAGNEVDEHLEPVTRRPPAEFREQIEPVIARPTGAKKLANVDGDLLTRRDTIAYQNTIGGNELQAVG